jgi:hypothetical protein
VVQGGSTAVSLPPLFAALHIRVSHPEALRDLVRALSERAHYVVRTVAPDAAAVSVLGSHADGGEDELRRFLREWKAARPGVEAEVELDDMRAVTVIPLRGAVIDDDAN